MHPTRAASLLAALGAVLIAAALLLRALALGEAFAKAAQTRAAAVQYLPTLGGYVLSPDGQTIHFIQAPPSAPRTRLNWFSMPVNGGVPVSSVEPSRSLRPFRVADGQAYLITAGGSSLQLASPRGEQVQEARLSPDGTALAFSAKTETRKSRLYILDEKANLTWLGEEDEIFDLDWSDDGKMIAFVAPRERVDQVFTASADGETYQQVTRDPLRKSRPQWSPDASQIAYLAFEGGFSLTIGTATPTVTQFAPAPTLPPSAAGPEDEHALDVDLYLVSADGSTQRRLTDNPEQELLLGWLNSSRGAELAFTTRLAEHPQVEYLFAIEPTSGEQRRVYPTMALDTIECPAQISEGGPAVARITVSSSALVPQDMPLILRVRGRPFLPFENIQAAAARSETVTLLPGETRALEWEFTPASGRITYLSVVANTTPRMPVSEKSCSASNTLLGLPGLPYLAIGLPLMLVGMALCVPRLLQIRRRWLWLFWASGLLVFWGMFLLELRLG